MGFFFCGFLATDSGLNIMAFPCFLDCPASFSNGCAFEGSDVSFVPVSTDASFLGASFRWNEASSSALWASSSIFPPLSNMGSLLNPGAAPVFRLTPLPSPPLPATEPFTPPFVAAARFGAGRNELKPPKAPPPTLAFFAGGPSSFSSPTASFLPSSGRLTRILCGLERSTTFWKADLVGFAVGFCDLLDRCFSSSDSEPSDSE